MEETFEKRVEMKKKPNQTDRRSREIETLVSVPVPVVVPEPVLVPLLMPLLVRLGEKNSFVGHRRD